MDPSNTMGMSRQGDEMPDLSLDFSNFDMFVATDDERNAAAHQMQMDSLSVPHSTHTSPMLNPIPDHTQGYGASQMVGNVEMARLHHHLEQQRRLNELNQLQNRILQQQVRLNICAMLAPDQPMHSRSSRLWAALPHPRMFRLGIRD